jgi:hypothetical protein
MEHRIKQSIFRLNKNNEKAIAQLMEEWKLDNKNQTFNVVVERYCKFKELEPLFLSFLGFYESLNTLLYRSLYTELKNLEVTRMKFPKRKPKTDPVEKEDSL